MLQENASLESLFIRSSKRYFLNTEEYIAVVTVLQHNSTLKTLSLYFDGSLELNDDEDKQIVALLKKNYALESLPDLGWGGGRCGHLFAIEWSRTSVSNRRRVLHLERRRSVEQGE
jgi:hypothetical protein